MKTLTLSQPHAIILIGIPGSGKSFFAEKFASTFGAPLVSVDKIEPFAKDTASAIKIARECISEIVKTKQSFIVEADGDTRSDRLEFASFLKKSGYKTLYVWVQTDRETASQRAAKVKGLDQANFAKAVKRFKAPLASEESIVISGKHTYASQAKIVLKRLSEPRAEISNHAQPPARGTIVVH